MTKVVFAEDCRLTIKKQAAQSGTQLPLFQGVNAAASFALRVNEALTIPFYHKVNELSATCDRIFCRGLLW